MIRLGPGFAYWAELLPALLVFSVGLSMIVAPLTATVLADAGERDAGIASGVNNAVARVAGLLGIAVVGAAVAGGGNTLDLSGFRMSMAITAGLVAAGGAIGLAGIRNRDVSATQREIVFDHVTKRYAGRDDGGARRPDPRDPGGHVLRARRPVRRRQDDGAQDGQPADPVRLRRHPHRRPLDRATCPSSSCGAGSAT